MTNYFLVLITTFYLFFTSNANNISDANNASERIISGSDAPHGKYPSYALISSVEYLDFLTSQNYICGGVILAHQWVITAAHCTVDHEPENIWVHAGFFESKRIKFQQRSPCIKKIEHPEYARRKGSAEFPNDISILQLRTPFFFYNLVRPAILPRNKKDVVEDNLKCDIVGFGNSERFNVNPKPVFPDVLQETDINIYPNWQCKRKWLYRYTPEIQICIWKQGTLQTSCKGDSGGPLYCFDKKRNTTVVRGITSWGISSCDATKYPSVYTRTSYYVDWIRDHVRYGEWVNGDCSVSCGEGTRLDKRECIVPSFCEDPDLVLHRVSKCKMADCPNGENVCLKLKCSPDAVCLPDETRKYGCKCLPEFVGDGRTCIVDEDKYYGQPGYSEWTLGKCEGWCGVGKRVDTRKCEKTACKEEDLKRTVDCRLDTPCTGNQGCEAINLICDQNALCVKYSTEKEYECECFVGFTGNGTYCERGFSSSGKLNADVLFMMLAAIISCLI